MPKKLETLAEKRGVSVERLLNENFSPILLKIGSTQLKALVDTGAEVSLISSKIVKSCGLTVSQIRSATLKDFSGQSKGGPLGTCEALIKFLDREFIWRFLVYDNLIEEAIIGRDILKPVWHDPYTVNFRGLMATSTKGSECPPPQHHCVVPALSLSDGVEGDPVPDSFPHASFVALVKNDSQWAEREFSSIQFDFADIFADSDFAYGTIETEFTIETSGDPVDTSHRLRWGQKKTEIAEYLVDQLLAAGVIEHANSPWCASPVLAWKGTTDSDKLDPLNWRFCVDYKGLNNVTTEVKGSLPTMRELLFQLNGSKIFTKLDMQHAYFNIPLNHRDKEKTAFRLNDIQYQYTRLPFGLKNAPIFFHSKLKQILRKQIREKKVLVYMDDILILGKEEKQHVSNVYEVLSELREAGVLLKKRKCQFGAQEIRFLGFDIANGRIRPVKDKLATIRKYPEPTNEKDVKSFLGVLGFYRDFVPDLASKQEALSRLTRKDVTFRWTSVEQNAFDKVKEEFSNASELVLPCFDRPFLLRTDASLVAVAAVLSQKDDSGIEKPLCFASKTLTADERSRSIYYRELLAIHWSVTEKFSDYLHGNKCIVKTDHQPIVTDKDTCDKYNMVRKMRSDLSMFDLEFEHVPGKQNVIADTLSRIGDDNTVAPIVVNVEPKQILTELHENKSHMGASKIIQELKSRGISWPNFEEDVKCHIQTCQPCLQTRKPGPSTAMNMGVLDKVKDHNERVHLDHAGPFPVKSRSGHRFILIIIDSFSKWCMIVPCFSTSTVEVIHSLDRWINQFGCPKTIVSDQGTCFTSGAFQEYLHSMGTQHILSSSNHPQSNGQAERQVKTVKEALSKYMLSMVHPEDWENAVEQIMFDYNTTTHSVTEKTPFELLYGKKARTSFDQLIGSEPRLSTLAERKSNILRWRRVVSDRIDRRHATNSHQFNRRKREPDDLHVGDIVYLAVRNVQNLGPKSIGPFHVRKRCRNNVFQLSNGRHYHRNRLSLQSTATENRPPRQLINYPSPTSASPLDQRPAASTLPPIDHQDYINPTSHIIPTSASPRQMINHPLDQTPPASTLPLIDHQDYVNHTSHIIPQTSAPVGQPSTSETGHAPESETGHAPEDDSLTVPDHDPARPVRLRAPPRRLIEEI